MGNAFSLKLEAGDGVNMQLRLRNPCYVHGECCFFLVMLRSDVLFPNYYQSVRLQESNDSTITSPQQRQDALDKLRIAAARCDVVRWAHRQRSAFIYNSIMFLPVFHSVRLSVVLQFIYRLLAFVIQRI